MECLPLLGQHRGGLLTLALARAEITEANFVGRNAATNTQQHPLSCGHRRLSRRWPGLLRLIIGFHIQKVEIGLCQFRTLEGNSPEQMPVLQAFEGVVVGISF